MFRFGSLALKGAINSSFLTSSFNHLHRVLSASVHTSPLNQSRVPSAKLVQVERDGPVLLLTLNNPVKRNALSLEVLEQLNDNLRHVSASSSTVQAVILRATGKVFSAGHDLSELMPKTGSDFHASVFKECSKVMNTIHWCRVPVIAAVSGLATAAGCQLVASCDLAVAGESSKFATPGVMVGLFCSTPGVALGRAVPTKVAMEMLLTAESIDAQRALQHGLINKVVPDDQVDTAALELARKICQFSPTVIALGKKTFNEQMMKRELEAAYTLTEEVMVKNLIISDGQEGVTAFTEKRKPVWESLEPEIPE